MSDETLPLQEQLVAPSPDDMFDDVNLQRIIHNAPSISTRKQEAGLPVHLSMEGLYQLGNFTVVYLSEVQFRPGFDGSLHATYFAGLVGEDGLKYTIVFGGNAIIPVLEKVEIPFQARLSQVETGRGLNKAWVLVDPV